MAFEYLLTVCTEGVLYCTSRHCLQFSHLLFSLSSSIHRLGSSRWIRFLPVRSPFTDPVNYLNGLSHYTAFNSPSTVSNVEIFSNKPWSLYIESSLKLMKNSYNIHMTVTTATFHLFSPGYQKPEDQHDYVIIVQLASPHSPISHGLDIPSTCPTCWPLPSASPRRVEKVQKYIFHWNQHAYPSKLR